jgi:chromosomal replication initiation ATPase DnaA
MKREAPLRQLAFDLPHQVGQGVEDFLAADSNRDALQAVSAWPRWPSVALLVDGPAGSGKTHLARIFQLRAEAIYLAGPAIWSAADPLRRLGGSAACVVDDADQVDDERLLLHLYNLLAERRGHLLLTAQKPLAMWRLGLPDLISRLKTAWCVPIRAPDEALLAALLVKQFADRQLRVDPGVVEYLTSRMERSFAAVGLLVRALDRASLRARRPIGLPLARETLRELADAPASTTA